MLKNPEVAYLNEKKLCKAVTTKLSITGAEDWLRQDSRYTIIVCMKIIEWRMNAAVVVH